MSEQIEIISIAAIEDEQQIRSRLNPEVVEQICRSFLAIGQLQPVRVRRHGDRFKMVDGHHRKAAGQRAGWASLMGIIEREQLAAGDVVQRQLIANCQRAGLWPLEMARGLETLMAQTGMNAGQAAVAVGLSNSKVTRLTALLSLPPNILAHVETGRISASSGYELSQIADPVEQAQLASKLAAGQMTRDKAASTRRHARHSDGEKKKSLSRVTVPLGTGRSVSVTAPNLTLETFVGVIEELLGKARRERSRGTELSTFVRLLRDQTQGQ